MCERASLDFLDEFNALNRYNPQRLAVLAEAMAVCANYGDIQRVVFSEVSAEQVRNGSAFDRSDFMRSTFDDRGEIRALARSNLSWPTWAWYCVGRFVGGVATVIRGRRFDQ